MASGRSQFAKTTNPRFNKVKIKKNKGCGKVMSSRRKATRYS